MKVALVCRALFLPGELKCLTRLGAPLSELIDLGPQLAILCPHQLQR